MTTFSQSNFAQAWIDRFPEVDRQIVRALLDEILLVGAGEFKNGIYEILDKISANSKGGRPIALYAEREVKKINSKDEFGRSEAKIGAFFPGTEAGRAIGDGSAPVPFNPSKPETGSEGPVANLITSYCRYHKAAALDHPGPTLLRGKEKMGRKERVGPIVIVTDFIGSGNRIWEMLEAFRKVASVRSWYSYGFVEFHVVAYAGTEEGIRKVQSASLNPKVSIFTGCPTVSTAFRAAERKAARALCGKYPAGHHLPLGYNASGALIAFEHGMPNNAPPIFYCEVNNAGPLFQGRTSIDAASDFPSSNRKRITDRAKKFLKLRTNREILVDVEGTSWVQTLLVLAALNIGARTELQISSQTRLSIKVVSKLLALTRSVLWSTTNNKLTALGRAELKLLRSRRSRYPILPIETKPFYYPTQLRAR